MLTIDGSFGEGGGQILRTSLALSLVTGKPFRIEKIRAGRKTPGLLRQHLTAVNAAAEVGCAEITGATIGSQHLTFVPHGVTPGKYYFAVGSAGSATLVLQTVLPALLIAGGPSTLVLEGGTHNPHAPPFDFLAKVFLPLVNRMGSKVIAELEQPGFYPAGGGKFKVKIEPAERFGRLDLPERGQVQSRRARAIVANLPRSIAERELAVIGQRMSWNKAWLEVEEAGNSRGPGNVVMIEIESEHVTEVFTSFGQRGVQAEAVANKAAQEARDYLSAEVPVGEYLADQLLVPVAVGAGGSFTTLPLSRHSTTNIAVIQKFLDLEIVASPLRSQAWSVEVKK